MLILLNSNYIYVNDHDVFVDAISTHATYYALQKFEDLLGGVQFTLRTDHNNLIFMNQNGSRKVLNWKLSIQYFNLFIQHIQGVNILADVFSRTLYHERD